MKTENWTEEPDKKDYPAALNYLSLLIDPREAEIIVKALKKTSQIEHFAAKDLFRASGLPHLGDDDHEVEKDLAKVKAGEKLSPVLLVRGTPLWVADGYHRICASYHLDEDEMVPCLIVDRLVATRQ